jgi:acetyl-CoA carboxylase biotin carboxyl carrier protein
MPKEEPVQEGTFNLDELRELISLMEKHGLTEINLREGDTRWLLRRGGTEGPSVVAGMPYPAPGFFPQPMHAPNAPAVAAPVSAASAPAASNPSGAAPSGAASAAKADGPSIKAPTVGTFYASPTPNDPPFVTPGTKVTPDTVVCIIEAMKVFNQITADTTGTIAEVLCRNGDAVEFGQPLFRLE